MTSLHAFYNDFIFFGYDFSEQIPFVYEEGVWV